MSKNKNSLIAVVAILLVLVIAVGALGYFSKGFIDWDYKKWINLDDKNEETETTETTNTLAAYDDNGNIMHGQTIYKMPAVMTLSGISATSTDSILLQATVKPDYADNKLVDWNVAFVNPNSAWASGKKVADYLTVTTNKDGDVIGNLNCLQAFREQIKITVKSRQNPTITANCVVDYLTRLNYKIRVIGHGSIKEYSVSGNSILFTPQMTTIGDVEIYNISSVLDYGTISETYKTEFYFTYSTEYLNALLFSGLDVNLTAFEQRYNVTDYEHTVGCGYIDGFDVFGLSVLNLSTAAKNEIINKTGANYAKLVAAAKTIDNVTANYGTLEIVGVGQNYGYNYTLKINVCIDHSAFAVDVTGIDLNTPSMVV